MKPGHIPHSVTVCNETKQTQSLTGIFRVPAGEELTIVLGDLKDLTRVRVWSTIQNAVLSNALRIKGFNDTATILAHCGDPDAPDEPENPPSTV